MKYMLIGNQGSAFKAEGLSSRQACESLLQVMAVALGPNFVRHWEIVQERPGTRRKRAKHKP
jgi:hypothetical protein